MNCRERREADEKEVGKIAFRQVLECASYQAQSGEKALGPNAGESSADRQGHLYSPVMFGC